MQKKRGRQANHGQGTIAVHTQSTEGRTIMFKKKIDPRANGSRTFLVLEAHSAVTTDP